MALRARDIPVTREEVYEWLQEYEGKIEPTKKMREFIDEKLRDKEVDPQLMVDTASHDGLQDETSLLDMILMDVESYG